MDSQATIETISRFDTPLQWQTVEYEVGVVGSGAQFVYAYYFPFQKEAARASRKKVWPIKIGKTRRTVPIRIAETYYTATIFQPPVVGFWARCSDCKQMEDDLHEFFESKNLKNEKASNVGTEWYETNFAEIRRAYREIVWAGWWRLPIRLYHRFPMEAAAKRSKRKSYSDLGDNS